MGPQVMVVTGGNGFSSTEGVIVIICVHGRRQEQRVGYAQERADVGVGDTE